MILLKLKKHIFTFDNHADFYAFIDALIVFRDTVEKTDYRRAYVFSADTRFEMRPGTREVFDEISKN